MTCDIAELVSLIFCYSVLILKFINGNDEMGMILRTPYWWLEFLRNDRVQG